MNRERGLPRTLIIVGAAAALMAVGGGIVGSNSLGGVLLIVAGIVVLQMSWPPSRGRVSRSRRPSSDPDWPRDKAEAQLGAPCTAREASQRHGKRRS